MSRITSMLLAGILAASMLVVLFGCIGGKKRVPTSKSSRTYAVVKARQGDTTRRLANRYLEDPDKGWVIESSNQTKEIKAGNIYVIPLLPLNKGGLKEDGYQLVPVLSYSGFHPSQSNSVTISKADFERHMAYIKEKGYQPVSLDKLFDFFELKDSLPKNAIAITINDIGRGTHSIAYPILKKYGYKASIFVCTDFVTGRGEALTWDEIREMKQAGFEIGNYTKTLRNLTRRQPDETFEDFYISVDREMTVSSLTFKSELGKAPEFFAYPYGAVNELAISLLKKNGFRGAFTQQAGANPFFIDRYLVKRNAISGNTTQEDFASLFTFFAEENLK